MKRYIAFIVAILILFAVGCSNPQTSAAARGRANAVCAAHGPGFHAGAAVIRAQSHAGRGCGIFAP